MDMLGLYEIIGGDRITRVDRISDLSDDILCKILFFMSTKDAIRTSVLSTRWKNLWKSVRGLDLDDEHFTDDDDAFINFVDGFLEAGESHLYKFDLVLGWEVDASRWTSWINTLNRRKIQELIIDNVLDDKFELPSSLLRSDTLVSLKLGFIILNIPENVFLPSLKTMHLEYMVYADDSAVEKLISSCENLEILMMTRIPYDNIKDLCVRSKSLKSFTLEFYNSSMEDLSDRVYRVMIDTPRLEYLDLTDDTSKSIEIKNLGSRVKVDVDVLFDVDTEFGLFPEDPEINSIRNFLNGISTVYHLIISYGTLEVIYYFWRIKSHLPKFNSLYYLEATFGWRMFPIFVQCCPNLKYLVLTWASPPTNEEISIWDIPKCLSTSLEYLEVKTPIKGDARDMEPIKFFLKNSLVLKKLTVCLRFSQLQQKKNLSYIMEELKTCPRGSTECYVRVNCEAQRQQWR